MQQDCEYDAVEIRSGLDQQQSRLHGAYCGSQPPQPVTSESNALRVTFTSDNTVQKSGFAAFFFTGRQQTSPAGTAVDFGVVRPSVRRVCPVDLSASCVAFCPSHVDVLSKIHCERKGPFGRSDMFGRIDCWFLAWRLLRPVLAPLHLQ